MRAAIVGEHAGQGRLAGLLSLTVVFACLCAGAASRAEASVSVQGLAANGSDSCAVLSTGHVQCWGSNYLGQLGDGNYSSADTATEVEHVSNATQVTTGAEHACALLGTGHIDCWGYGFWGQLGAGKIETSDGAFEGTADTPVEVKGVTNASEVSGGGDHTCAVLSTGHIDCWGLNDAGQLGDGTTAGPEECESGSSYPCSRTPVEVQGITNAVQVAAGGSYTCAVLSTGHMDCWGSNSEGELGNGTTTSSDSPVEVKGITTAAQAAAYGPACAVLSTHHIDCWGSNYAGQLGNGTMTSSDIPVEVTGITTASKVAAGRAQACGLLTSGHIDCWGENEDGELGNGTTVASDKPVEVHGISTATQVAVPCATLTTSQVQCWGANLDGQLGNGTTAESETPVEVKGMTTASQIMAGGVVSCAVLSTHHVQCWGFNGRGELGTGNTADADTPVEVAALTTATQVLTGFEFACAVLSTGKIDCWGSNESGQLGTGGTDGNAHDSPAEVKGITNATQAAADDNGACAVLSTGHIDCWGFTPTFSATALAEVTGITTATQVAVSRTHSCALLSTGHIDCWGANNDGQLGNGTTTSSNTPVEVQGISNATHVATGLYHTCATLSTHHVECWGYGHYGQLGNGTTTNSDTPIEVQGITNATAVSAGEETSCALLPTGHVQCWGAAPLGSKAISSSDTAIEVPGISNASQVSVGEANYVGLTHTCLTLSSGHAYCWGEGFYGQLGNGTTWSTVPIEVLGFPPKAPSAVTGSATGVTPVSATLKAQVNPEGGDVTSCEFDYGTTEAYGSTAPCSSLPGYGTSSVEVAASLSGLKPHTTYHYRIVAGDAGVTGNGSDGTFTTLLNAPAVVSGSASSITQTAASLNATVNPEGGEVTSCAFEYGTSESYGQSASCTPAPGSGTSAVSVSGAISGLVANTTYHFRIAATNAGGMSKGEDQTFKTLPNAPTVTSGTATSISQTGATLNATVNPNGGAVSASNCKLEYGTTPSYGSSATCTPAPGSGTSEVAVSATVGSLAANTAYHFRVVATNAGGTSYGEDEAFDTLPNPPAVVTGAASSIAQTTATVEATVNPEGGNVTSCTLEYGSSLPSGTSVPCTPTPGSATGPVGVSAALSGLSANTSYAYRVVATNAGGTSVGGEQTFKTLPNPPTVVTGSASSATQTTVTLNATVNPNGGEVSECNLEYGTTTSYTASAPCSPAPGSGTSPAPVAATIGGLTANTTYHFRVSATNPGGPSTGEDQTFTTEGPPEFGRCLKVTTGKGSYATTGCTTTTATNSYEWYSGFGSGRPLEKAGFTTAIKPTTKLLLETKGSQKIYCNGQTSDKASYTGNHALAGVILKLTGCYKGVTTDHCQNQATQGEVASSSLEARLGLLKVETEAKKDKVGLAFKPVSGETIAEFECESTPVTLKGSVIIESKADSMSLTVTLKAAESKGVQKWTQFVAGAKQVLEMKIGAGTVEQAGLSLTTIQTNEEKVEANTVT